MEKLKAVGQCVKYFLIFSITPVISALLLMGFTLILRRFDIEIGAEVNCLVEIVSCCMIIGLCYLSVKRKKCSFINSVKLHKISGFIGVIYGLLGLSAFVVLTILINLFPVFVDSSGGSSETIYSSKKIVELIILFVSKSVAAPVAEEVIFRGLMYSELKRGFSKVKASIAVTLIFAILHFSVSAVTVIVALIMGFFFNYLTDRYNSIVPCVIVHSGYNFANTFIRNNINFMDLYGTVIAIVSIVVFLIAVSCVCYDIRRNRYIKFR